MNTITAVASVIFIIYWAGFALTYTVASRSAKKSLSRMDKALMDIYWSACDTSGRYYYSAQMQGISSFNTELFDIELSQTDEQFRNRCKYDRDSIILDYSAQLQSAVFLGKLAPLWFIGLPIALRRKYMQPHSEAQVIFEEAAQVKNDRARTIIKQYEEEQRKAFLAQG